MGCAKFRVFHGLRITNPFRCEHDIKKEARQVTDMMLESG